MLGGDHGHAALPQRRDHLAQPACPDRIKLGGRFVQAEHLRAHGQHSGDRQTLQLAARQLGGRAGLEATQSHQLQHLRYPAADLGAWDEMVARAEGDVLADRSSDDLTRRVLQDQPDVLGESLDAVVGQICRPVPDSAAEHTAIQLADHTGQRLQQGRLARLGGTHDRGAAAGSELGADMVQCVPGAGWVAVADRVDREVLWHAQLSRRVLRNAW